MCSNEAECSFFNELRGMKTKVGFFIQFLNFVIITMSDPGAGPSNASVSRSEPRRNLFEVFTREESDSEDDFDGIPHVSDDSGSSSDEDDEGARSRSSSGPSENARSSRYVPMLCLVFISSNTNTQMSKTNGSIENEPWLFIFFTM